MEPAEAALIENLQTFIAFARKRVGDPHLAEDVVQESLLKALQSGRKPSDKEDVVAWFYRILRRSIIDLYRRNDVRTRAIEKFKQELPEQPDAEAERTICGCIKSLMADLPEQYRSILDRIDLKNSSISDLAAELGQSPNNVTVRLHRARKQLKDRVMQCCKVKSAAACFDCNCE